MKRIFSKENRALISELVRVDFKLRYQGSVLGYVWSLLSPLLLFLILYFVFVYFLQIGKGIPHYPVYLLLGIVIWNFFKELTNQGLASIVDQGPLIRKINIPRWILVTSTSISALISLGFNLIIVALLFVINKVPLHPTVILLPIFLIEIYLVALGISLFLAAAYVKYRDIKYIWEVLIQAGFYITPIIYPLTKITNLTIRKIIVLSPIAQALQDARYAVVGHSPTTLTTRSIFKGGPYSYIPYLVIIIVLVIGIRYFRKQSKYFAENV